MHDVAVICLISELALSNSVGTGLETGHGRD